MRTRESEALDPVIAVICHPQAIAVHRYAGGAFELVVLGAEASADRADENSGLGKALDAVVGRVRHEHETVWAGCYGHARGVIEVLVVLSLLSCGPDRANESTVFPQCLYAMVVLIDDPDEAGGPRLDVHAAGAIKMVLVGAGFAGDAEGTQPRAAVLVVDLDAVVLLMKVQIKSRRNE